LVSCTCRVRRERAGSAVPIIRSLLTSASLWPPMHRWHPHVTASALPSFSCRPSLVVSSGKGASMSSPQRSSGSSATIDALLQETRVFPPPLQFAATAVVRNPAVYERARQDPEAFWAEAARRLDWFNPWDKVLEWNAPWAKWFVGGQLNACYNCVD